MSIRKFNLFFGLQIKQIKDQTFICKYVKELLKRFKLDEVKHMITPIHPITLGLNKEFSIINITFEYLM